MIFPSGMPKSKRVLDLLIASLLLLILSPLLLGLAVMVLANLGKPILFKQRRPGYRSRPFLIYKFRTMTVKRDITGNLLPDEARQTRIGTFLRSSSMDELPEFINVLRGEMSLVGPRPLLMEYIQRYTPEQARRHDVLPGITGWAQINGRNTLSWERKFELDVWYVDHWSLWLDMKILFTTMVKVLKREGINQPGFSTAEEFMGSNTDQSPNTKGNLNEPSN